MTRDTSQIRAITSSVDSSSLVVAPPGYGKTYVMTRRISYLIRSGSLNPPKRLLGLTFTNAAAAEMIERVSRDIPRNKMDYIDLSTIHSFCYQCLVAYGSYISIVPDFIIMGETEAKSLLQTIASQNRLDLNANYGKAYQAYRIWITERVLKRNTDFKDPTLQTQFETIYRQYLEQCHREGKVDFDHVLALTYELFSTQPAILELYRSTYSHILVDEFQDTNPLQFELLALLIEGVRPSTKVPRTVPVFLFGDEQQAIYEFLGATPENVTKGTLRFNCTKYSLERNHRTRSPKILELSSALRVDIPTLPSTQPALLHIHDIAPEEASTIKEQILDLNLPLHRICVIAQNKLRLRQIQDEFKAEESLPFIFIPDFTGNSLESQFTDFFHALRSIPNATTGSLVNAIRKVIEGIEIDDEHVDIFDLLMDMARDYDYRARGLQMPLSALAKDFVNHILLEVNWGHIVRQNVKNKVYVSTIHGVKGLEFDHVILCGLENYVIPHSSICVDHCNHGNDRSIIKEVISEAERLLYVGVTRSVSDISFYAVRRAWSDNKQKYVRRLLTCLLFPLIAHLELASDLSTDLCGYAVLHDTYYA